MRYFDVEPGPPEEGATRLWEMTEAMLTSAKLYQFVVCNQQRTRHGTATYCNQWFWSDWAYDYANVAQHYDVVAINDLAGEQLAYAFKYDSIHIAGEVMWMAITWRSLVIHLCTERKRPGEPAMG